jgi:hypothetical protein
MGIIETLEQFGITSVYHFTDRSNLQTIERYGLQSLRNIENLNIPVQHFGAERLSHQLDRERGLDGYVHLSFIQDHPMYYIAKKRGSIIKPVWLEIDISVLFEYDTLFCDGVANSSSSHLFRINEVVNNIDLETMVYSRNFDTRKEARKAEIMVCNYIPIEKVIGAYYGN